jgi:hypothetical protein
MMIHRNRILLAGFLLLAILLTFLKVPVASSQGVAVVASLVEEPLPVNDPNAAVWQEATALDIPLSAQNVSPPRLLEASVRSLTARALHNNEQLAILVEWEDATQNDQNVRVQDFRDAVAVQFPLSQTQPFFCMGQAGGNVNIWHWKADWNAKMTTRQDVDTTYPDMYVDGYTFANTEAGAASTIEEYEDLNYVPARAAGNLFASALQSPVEDIIAGGFGTLTSQGAEGQNVQGYGTWAEGKWQVIFTRTLDSEEDEDIQLLPGRVYSIAFAAWDGEHEERNGQKSTSQWVSLQLERPVTPVQPSETVTPTDTGFPLIFWIIIGALVVFMMSVGIIAAKLPNE